jgi:hypothetical protein
MARYLAAVGLLGGLLSGGVGQFGQSLWLGGATTSAGDGDVLGQGMGPASRDVSIRTVTGPCAERSV